MVRAVAIDVFESAFSLSLTYRKVVRRAYPYRDGPYRIADHCLNVASNVDNG